MALTKVLLFLGKEQKFLEGEGGGCYKVKFDSESIQHPHVNVISHDIIGSFVHIVSCPIVDIGEFLHS